MIDFNIPRCTTSTNGTVTCRQFGVIHRIDGPAVIYADGSWEWRKFGRLHRMAGPAVTWPDGISDWFLDDYPMSSYENYQAYTECSDATILLLKLKWGEITTQPYALVHSLRRRRDSEY